MKLRVFSIFASLLILFSSFGFTSSDIPDFEDLQEFLYSVYLAIVGKGEAKMVLVPAGEFEMGCDREHNGEYSPCAFGETPLHSVWLDDYYIDKTEVTNAEYGRCVAAGVCDEPYSNSSFTRPWYFGNPAFDDYPVVHVGWAMAEQYCGWVGKRLPTEAEWEKAARGTEARAYPWGDGYPNCSLANSHNNATNNRCVGDTSPVGSYPLGASPYGVLDMTGNAWEWVSDFHSYYYYSESPYENPQGPASGNFRVLRGGDWSSNWYYL